MLEHARKEKRRTALQQREELEARLARVREKEKKIQKRNENREPPYKRARIMANVDRSDDNDEACFMLDDYESDDGADRKSKISSVADYGLSVETQALMAKLGMSLGSKTTEEEVEAPDELKIFYCSRTHSQLTQFTDELRKVKIPPALQPDAKQDVSDNGSLEVGVEELKHLTLGARKNLCINPRVSKLGNATAINERCLELQQPNSPAERKCPFLPSNETEHLVNDFRDHALAEIRDIEDLGALGKRLGVCPYYAVRPAIRSSEIVTLPYPLLLQKSAREALNLSLKDHVVIIDEAHNLMDAITGIYSISISLAQLQRSRAQLGIYLQKFRSRLKGKNRVYVTQTVRLHDSLISYLQTKASTGKGTEGAAQVADMMAGKGVDQINLFKLMRYLQESKLARKVDGYIVHAEQQDAFKQQTTIYGTVTTTTKSEPTIPVLTHIQSFFLALMNPSAEGRFFYLHEEGQGISLKYMLLDPTHHFKEIVEEARAVILAGGTMSPMSDYTEHLFSYLPKDKITTLSCGHIIPKENLIAIPVVESASGRDFEFTFERRNSETMIRDLGESFMTLLPTIPDGVVIFFPSYAYLDRCISIWQRPPSSGTQKPIWTRLSSLKPIFHESSRTAASTTTSPASSNNSTRQTESILTAYSHAIASSPNHRGALLLSVISGSLSEGINFSDSLGRAVIVIGLPFPNPRSAEWKSKLSYITQKTGGGTRGKEAARELYENACMRAVNQCVGRAIRHRGDYAAVMVMDRRYAVPGGPGRKLPVWIKESLVDGCGVVQARKHLESFFKGKK